MLVAEDGPAVGVFALERGANRPFGVRVGEASDALRADELDDLADVLFEALAVGVARASADNRQAATQLRVTQPEVQDDAAAHRETDEVRALDAEVVDQRAQVFDQQLLRVQLGIGRNARGWKPALAVRDTAIQAAEGAHVQLPGAVVAAELVAKDDGEAGAGVFVVEVDAVDLSGGHAQPSVSVPDGREDEARRGRRLSRRMVLSFGRQRP